MADLDDIRDGDNFGLNSPADTSKFYLKGMNSMSWGLKNRMSRIFNPGSDFAAIGTDPDEWWDGETFLPVMNAQMKEMAGLTQEILHVERVGVNDSFFQLGGHSLLATRLFSEIRTAFGIDLPLRTIFRMPTVAGLAVEIVQRIIEEDGEA